MSFRVALAVDNFAGVEEVGHLVLSSEGVVSVTSFFVVVRLVFGNTVLLALSRRFLVCCGPFREGGTQAAVVALGG